MATLRLSPAAKAKREKQTNAAQLSKRAIKRQKQAEHQARLKAQQDQKRQEDYVRAAIWLADNFPHLFTDPPTPLSIGIDADVLTSAPFGMKHKIKSVLGAWVRSDAYIAQRIPGKCRININGEISGKVGG